MTVLGSILFGLATPSEAAAMGSLGGMVLAVVYRAMTWQRLKEAVFLTAKTTAMVCLLFVGSWTFSSVFSYLGGESVVKDFMLSMDLSTVQFLLSDAADHLHAWAGPWSGPRSSSSSCRSSCRCWSTFNVDPLFFGMLVAFNLQTSFLTPPMAMAAYYLKGVAPPHVTLVDIFSGIMPYLGIVIFSMVLLYNFPGLALWLPEYLFGPG